MAKKKHQANGGMPDVSGHSEAISPLPTAPKPGNLGLPNDVDAGQYSLGARDKETLTRDPKSKSKGGEHPTGTLSISRNKHWRYISAFHGPWLQLPQEILETLAHSNFLSPRPRSTDPGVLYDLIKIRRLVDEASDLAVRAQNGTASSALVGADNGLPGGSLGLSSRGAGGNAKLSPERKYRMRELATQKLSHAYRLDEVAASVATMQGASALDNIANLVLQRNPHNLDARYVHFFHEKIPSRMMAESTPLTALDEIIAAEPRHAAPYRTRALTRIFKDDFAGAVQDLTESLALCRLGDTKHKAGRNQLVTMQAVKEEAEKRKAWSKEYMQENRVLEDDQPLGLEMQLLFQRGNQYLTLACLHIKNAMDGFRRSQKEKDAAAATARRASAEGQATTNETNGAPEVSRAGVDAYTKALEAREAVRKHAKRALRDYTTFLSKLDYAHAPVTDINGKVFGRGPICEQLDKLALPDSSDADIDASTAIALRENKHNNKQQQEQSLPSPMAVYEMSLLVSTSPPSNVPPFPPESEDPTENPHDEILTYHPLLPETLHALLLTHCLLQTPPTALLRHANNVARLMRLADGYPFFLAARSPARADWAEIMRKTNNFLGLSASWEVLCKVPSLSQSKPTTRKPSSSTSTTVSRIKAQNTIEKGSCVQLDLERQSSAIALSSSSSGPGTPPNGETQAQKRDRIHKEAVMEALGDDRVVDDETFKRAVEAREKRAWKDIVEEAQEQRQSLLGNGSAKIPGNQSSTAAVVDPAATKTEKENVGARSSLARESCASATELGASEHTRNETPTPSPQPLPKPRSNGVAKPAKAASRTFTAKDEEYLIGTERAEAIARWILEAPTQIVNVDGAAGKGKKGKARKKTVAPKVTGSVTTVVEAVV